MTYHEFHQEVYRHFRDYFSKERGWHFTMRKDGGVFPLYASEASGYVATSFWHISSREGMKLTPMVAIMIYREEDHFFYKYALKQRRAPVDAQDKSVLKLIQGVKVKNVWRQDNLKESRESSKDWTLSLYSEKNYATLPELFKALEADLEHFVPQMDELIDSIKMEHPDFAATRLTADDLAQELGVYERMRASRRKNEPAHRSETGVMNTQPSYPLNQILFGPPGTGKTYATIEMAVRIANPDFAAFNSRMALHAEFRRLKGVQRIAFTTFHQSLSYEDFVEGLKPKLDTDSDDQTAGIGYEVKRGIFKNSAIASIYSAVTASEAEEEKLALNFAQKYDEFVKSAQISLSEDRPVELTTWTGKKVYVRELSDRKNLWMYHGEHGETKHTVSRQRLIKLNNKIRENNISPGNVNRFIPEAIGGANNSTYYAAWKAIKDFVPPASKSLDVIETDYDTMADVISDLNTSALRFTNAPTHVLIIDEINRGNISAILGELITLLEPDKRLGAREELKVTLPYSRDEFGVPPNLYLIGTMNTADRSVEALDAALRRRFTFKEIGPQPGVITKVHPDGGTIQVGELRVDLAHLLTLLNQRIQALKDADHLLGHSYFLRLAGWEDLAAAFNDRIIPLLREYFFADYGQLQLVVGQGFCRREKAAGFAFAAADEETDDYADYKRYTFPRPTTETELEDYLRQLGLA